MQKKTLSSCQMCKNTLPPWVPQQLNSTKLGSPLLSAWLKLLFAFFCLMNKDKTSTPGRRDIPGQCTRIISRPQQEQGPAALTHSALHHVWPSACQAPAASRSPPGTTPKNRQYSLTHANISLRRACMQAVCTCTCVVCAHIKHARTLTLSLHLTFHILYHAIFSPWRVSLLHSALGLSYFIVRYIRVTLSNTLDWSGTAVSTGAVQLFTYLQHFIAATVYC